MKFSNEFIPRIDANRPTIPHDLPLACRAGERLFCRDPYILPYDGVYYLYRSMGEEGVECFLSSDLLRWFGPVTVFAKPADFDGKGCWFWAPEVHFYRGAFYLFTSVLASSTDHRMISVYRATNPLGPFTHLSVVSPTDWDAIDGTLFLDSDENPWLIFVHEWTCMPDKNGSMVAMRLSDDLTRGISEPLHLFYARDPDWASTGVTDGPFLYRTDAGELRMIWSNFTTDGYVVGLVGSENGKIDGKWSQMGTVYRKGQRKDFVLEGGHAMIFRGFDGINRIVFHSPNKKNREGGEFEHVTIYRLGEENGEPTLGVREDRAVRPFKQLLMRRDAAPFEKTPLPKGYRHVTYRRDGKGDLSFDEYKRLWFRVCPDWTEEQFDKFFADPLIPDDGFFVLLDPSGDAAGHSNLQLNEHRPGTATVHWVEVREDERGKRLGYIVSERVIEEATRRGYDRLYLTTDEFRIPAIKTYLKLGFRPVMWDTDMRPRWFPILQSLGYHEFFDENERPARYEY